MVYCFPDELTVPAMFAQCHTAVSKNCYQRRGCAKYGEIIMLPMSCTCMLSQSFPIKGKAVPSVVNFPGFQ